MICIDVIVSMTEVDRIHMRIFVSEDIGFEEIDIKVVGATDLENVYFFVNKFSHIMKVLDIPIMSIFCRSHVSKDRRYKKFWNRCS